MTPTQRTLAWLKENGYECGIVERYITYAPGDPRKRIRPGERIDLFGFIDIIAISPYRQTYGVQSTGQDFASHYRKIVVDKRDKAMIWLDAGNRILLFGWRKIKKVRGGKQMVWSPRILGITKDMIENEQS